MRQLSEGLREGDLENLISSFITIDEFNSKVGKDAIVVAFFVDDEDPANDLKEFIEKSPIKLLDVEVSPAANKQGFYVVFLEFLRNKEFPEKLIKVLKTIEVLCKVDNWVFKPYNETDAYDLTANNIKKTCNLKLKNKLLSERTKKQIINFLKESSLDYFSINNNDLELIKRTKIKSYNIVDFKQSSLDFSPTSKLLQENAVKLDSKSLRECREISYMLGDYWGANKIDNYFIIQRIGDPNMLIVHKNQ